MSRSCLGRHFCSVPVVDAIGTHEAVAYLVAKSRMISGKWVSGQQAWGGETGSCNAFKTQRVRLPPQVCCIW